ncbi:MAG TPA: formate dehydrogenase accessory sulfurtransferase FdhD [Tepidisphaeraceae bacterium]|jgi:FdhD protein|nr:formate dehydrogenase accessory sulfurtransferase FdhD [Tepidisphaeraceae bacterium]
MATASIWRYAGNAGQSVTDDLADEEPLEIRVAGKSIAITMRTPGPPGHDAELAAGFLLTEGMLRTQADLIHIEPGALDRLGSVVNVVPADPATVDFQKLTRHVFGTSSCGMCGKASIDAVHQQFAPIQSSIAVASTVILDLPNRLRAAQKSFDRTGGLHAAGIFTAAGELVVAREDVGRHNAVDKVLGFGLLNGLLPFGNHVLMVSGRSSFEIMQKALAGGVAIVAAVSAPSSLAVQLARDSGQTLIGFLRGDRMNLYTHRERVLFV